MRLLFSGFYRFTKKVLEVVELIKGFIAKDLTI